MSPFLPEVCNRTREQVSLRLDSELSELEEALVTAHLARCVTCRSFAGELETVTAALRAAPLAEPPMCVQLPRRHPARRRLRVGVAQVSTAAAGAIVVVVALASYVGFSSSPTRISALDIQSARERMLAKELQFEALQGAPAKRAPTPAALEAAEGTTLGRTRSVASSDRSSNAGRFDSPELPNGSG